MSEKIYVWLLRLYPHRFREDYGDEALQLFRDRARDEKGFLARVQLWLDLLADLVISLPREYHHAEAALIDASAHHSSEGIPSFCVLKSELPHHGSLLFGTLLSLAFLGTLSVLISHVENYRPASVGVEPHGVVDARSSSFKGPQSQASDDAEEETTVLGYPAMAVAPFRPGDAKPSDLLPGNAGSAMMLASEEETKLDAAEQRRVINGAIANLKEYYVYPDVAQKMADALIAHQKSGDDAAVADGAAFADLLTTQMRDVSHDRHLKVAYNRVKTPQPTPGPTSEEIARYRKDMERSNCTFEKVEILPFNVGYLKFNEFPAPSVCRTTVVAMMNRLRQVDAIIFDVRDNHGGSPDTVAQICTYLFNHPTHLNDMYNRREKTTKEYWTLPPVPGNMLADKPAYVLTSASTFSGAEEFSYDLKMLKRATLVGETTGGGAHPAGPHRIDDHFMIHVPFARPINPISKTDWEGTGVEPDVKVKAADALQTAEKLAQSKLRNR